MQLNQLEEKILKYWEKEKVFAKTQEKKKGQKSFVFFEGPPTANGRPGIHHILARSFKDLIPRFKTMQGYHVLRKGGWDTHGLPVEIQVEKQLGLKSKKDVENIVKGDQYKSLVKFNKACRESVWEFKDEWEKLTKRMGYWIDTDNAYITYENNYIESLWNIIKRFHDADLLELDYRVSPYCPRCGTTLSSHELAQGYKTTKDISIFGKFKLTNTKLKDAYFLAWTTTPWTLPGNVALAVHPKLNYVLVQQGDEQYILAEDRLEVLNAADGKEQIPYKVKKKYKGKELAGMTYEPLFDVSDLQTRASHKIYEADFVTAEDGTGIVHTAVMYGADDYELGSSIGLPKVHTVNDQGVFNDTVTELAGKPAKDVDTDIEILKILTERNTLYKKHTYEHEYPFCWRCNHAVLYYAIESYVVRISKLKEQLVKNNQQINWVPEHIKEGRFGEWLNEIKDWNFSRNRFWGTPLPIWTCGECDSMEVVGSYDELKERANNYKEIYKTEKQFDPHRPFIDKITMTCECGQGMERVPYVSDVWFDSGSMPFAQWHYPFENKEVVDDGQQFPADYICEAIDQTRGWFYTLLAVSTLLGYKHPPYKNVISLGLILDTNGQKMSKSKGNIVDPWEQMDKHGIDAIRWFFYVVNAPGESKMYDEKELRAHTQRFLLTLHNSLRFLSLASGGKKVVPKKSTSHVLDNWIDARFNQVVIETTDQLEKYDVTRAARSIEDFVDDLSNWYIRRSRDRFAESKSALGHLSYIIHETAKLIAPFVPFTAEHLWQELGNKDSVHLNMYPVGDKKAVKDSLLKEMNHVRTISSLGQKLRRDAGIKVRQPLASLYVVGVKPSKESQAVLQDELNVHRTTLAAPANALVNETDGEITVHLDTSLTADLKEEGFAREVMRQIQVERRNKGLDQPAKASVHISAPNILLDILSKYKKEIEPKTHSKLTLEKKSLSNAFEFVLDEMKVQIKIS